jgi:hypothetical protein
MVDSLSKYYVQHILVVFSVPSNVPQAMDNVQHDCEVCEDTANHLSIRENSPEFLLKLSHQNIVMQKAHCVLCEETI